MQDYGSAPSLTVLALNQTGAITVEAVSSAPTQVAAAHWNGTKYTTTATIPLNNSVTYQVASLAKNSGYTYEILFKSSGCTSAVLTVKVK